MFYVLYNKTDVIYCDEEYLDYHLNYGWQIYKKASTEDEANRLAEEACYLS